MAAAAAKFGISTLPISCHTDDVAVAQEGRRWIATRIDQARPVTLEDLAGRSPLQRFVLDEMGLWVARAAQWLGRLLAVR